MHLVTPLEIYIGLFIRLLDGVIVPLIFAIAFIVFLYGVFQYFIAGGADEEKKKQGKSFVLYGLIGFFLMVSIWGIVNLLVGTFGFGASNRPGLPSFENGTPGGGGGGNNLGGVGASCTPNDPGCQYGLVCDTGDFKCKTQDQYQQDHQP